MVSPRSLFATALVVGTALGVAIPGHIGLVEEKRAGRLGTIFLRTVIGTIRGAGVSRDPCPTWAHTGDTNYYYIAATSSNGAITATACFSNSTTVDSDREVNIWTFDENDLAVANCLTNLHYTNHFTCISVEGSECDNGYHDSGGFIRNARIPSIGSGTGSQMRLTADQSSAAQNAFALLVGQNLAITGDMPEMTFYDNNAANPDWPIFPHYQLNMVQGSTLSC